MANTPKGYPYPVGSDRVADGDNAIQSLAEAVDTNLGRAAQGRVTMPNVPTGGGTVSAAVSFPASRFTANPRVLANCVSNLPVGDAGFALAWATGISATGCTINLRTTRAGVADVDWIGLQV